MTKIANSVKIDKEKSQGIWHLLLGPSDSARQCFVKRDREREISTFGPTNEIGTKNSTS